jgi:hypothetical protein
MGGGNRLLKFTRLLLVIHLQLQHPASSLNLKASISTMQLNNVEDLQRSYSADSRLVSDSVSSSNVDAPQSAASVPTVQDSIEATSVLQIVISDPDSFFPYATDAHEAAGVIQAMWRNHLKRLAKAARMVQKHFRGKVARVEVEEIIEEKKEAVVVVQNRTRAFIARKKVTQMKSKEHNLSAVLFQKRWRIRCAKKQVVEMKIEREEQSAVKVQSHYRALLSFRYARKVKKQKQDFAVRYFQRLYRGHRDRTYYAHHRRECEKAARIIQAGQRRHRKRLVAWAVRIIQWQFRHNRAYWAAFKIQGMHRRYWAKFYRFVICKAKLETKEKQRLEAEVETIAKDLKRGLSKLIASWEPPNTPNFEYEVNRLANQRLKLNEKLKTMSTDEKKRERFNLMCNWFDPINSGFIQVEDLQAFVLEYNIYLKDEEIKEEIRDHVDKENEMQITREVVFEWMASSELLRKRRKLGTTYMKTKITNALKHRKPKHLEEFAQRKLILELIDRTFRLSFKGYRARYVPSYCSSTCLYKDRVPDIVKLWACKYDMFFNKIEQQGASKLAGPSHRNVLRWAKHHHEWCKDNPKLANIRDGCCNKEDYPLNKGEEDDQNKKGGS